MSDMLLKDWAPLPGDGPAVSRPQRILGEDAAVAWDEGTRFRYRLSSRGLYGLAWGAGWKI